MTYSENHAQFVMGGKLFGTETWATGFRIRALPAPSPSEWVNWCASAIAGYVSDASAYVTGVTDWGIAVTLEWIKLNAIDVNGHYLDTGSSNTTVLGTPITATGTTRLPPQVAIAASLTTPSSRGRAHAGRMYLPYLAATVGADGRITAANAAIYNLQLKNFLNAVNVRPAPVGATNQYVAVFSKVGLGNTNGVTGTKVGRVLDTHRSRRRSMLEDYSPTLAVTL